MESNPPGLRKKAASLLKEKPNKLKADPAEHQMLAAEYAMAFDLLPLITRFETEDETVQQILEIFKTLFAPGKLTFLSLRNEQTKQIQATEPSNRETAEMLALAINPSINHDLTDSEKGFLVKISHQGRPLGVIRVDDLCHPEYAGRYLNLSLSLAEVCGLALENTRKFELIKKSECRLRQEKEKLEDALAKIRKLSGLLPICCNCKKIRDDLGYWKEIESYIREHADVEFSHGICNDCARKLYPDLDLR